MWPSVGAWLHYENQVVESEGFDVDGGFPVEAGNLIKPLIGLELEDDSYGPKKEVLFHIEKAVELYNSENPSNQIKKPRLVKANRQLTGFMTFYITFTARDTTRRRRTYQTKVDANVRLEESVVLFCRRKPKKAQRPKYTVPDCLLDGDEKAEEMKKHKRKRSITEGKENQSVNTSGCCAASSSSFRWSP